MYKRYLILSTDDTGATLMDENGRPAADKIGVNIAYKQQFWNNLKCPSFKISKAEKLEYKKGYLTRYFDDYNKCFDQDYVNIEKESRDLFNLNIRPGVNFSSLSMENIGKFSTSDYDFGSQTNFRFGLEAEFIMGFNKNKWAIIIEPTYQTFDGQDENDITVITVDYKSIELPVGVRYYMFLNEKSKFFVNAQICFDFNANSSIERNINTDLDVKSGTNLVLGAGYKYNDKFSLEARYFTSRGILAGYSFWTSDYKTFSIVLGYSLF